MCERKNISNFLNNLKTQLKQKNNTIENSKQEAEPISVKDGLIKTDDSNGQATLIDIKDFIQDEELMLRYR